MDGNEEPYLKMKANEARQDLAPPSVSPQDSGMYSQHIDVQDEFFSQEGFTYTGFLLGAMAGSANNQEPYAQDSKSKDTKSELTQENDANSSSTLLLQQDDDPWNLTMFDNLELDQLYDNADGEQNKQRGKEKAEFYHDQESTSTVIRNHTQANSNEDQQKDITEEDIHIFLENEELADEGKEMDEDTQNDNSQLKPEMGMEFQTREEAQKFFNLYAYNVGFSVSIVSSYRTTSKKRNNEVIRFTMKCNKYGKTNEQESAQIVPQRQSTVIAKTDCKVEMVVSEKKGMWRITGLILLHNHELCPQSRFYRSHIYMSDGEKEMIRTMKHCNMPTRDMVAVLAYIRGGMAQLPYNKRKVSNYSTTINREVTNNDMMEVLDWFSKKKD
ncbi:uncharacterized protein [Lolium perenne]|uniref:uncharacterized protein n=1 Tax=Lolium perenne TaxID=4522 RepID=UPI0021F53A52|nr:uncharacterized protein LOC127331550 [Lolium perenne]